MIKAFKKSSVPIKRRDCSPSYSSSSSASSGSAHLYSKRPLDIQVNGYAPRTYPSPHADTSHPPKIIIRALKSYSAQTASQLSVKSGDFLEVAGELWSRQGVGWFEATNLLTRARGYVPMDLFQIFSSGGYQPSPTSKAVQPLNIKPSLPGPPASTNSAPQSPKQFKGPHQSHPPLTSSQPARNTCPAKPSAPRQPLYGVVRYDFVPERHDELQAKKGEAIILIAHSHHDWFVAKPIGRLGGPGLIPVNFVEVKDLATGKGLRPDAVNKLIQNNILPGIDEWIQATAAYKGSSIPLGRFENPTATSTLPKNISSTLRREMTKSHQQLRSKTVEPEAQIPRPHRTGFSQSANKEAHFNAGGSQLVDIPVPSYQAIENNTTCSEPLRSPPARSLERIASYDSSTDPVMADGAVPPVNSSSGEDGYATVEDLRERYGLFTHATVESFHKENEKYWFHLRSHFNCSSTTNPSGEETTTLVLYRLYEDFFDFHAELLDLFPEEAGRENYDRPSIFPKLPEPKEHTDELVCAERVNTLSVYLRDLSKLPSYIRDCELFYEFLGPREGDVELLEEMASSPGSEDGHVSGEVDPHNSSSSHCTVSRSGAQEPEPANLSSQPPAGCFKPPSSIRSSGQILRLSGSPRNNSVTTPEANQPVLPPTPSSRTPKPHGKTHTSNFSSSSSASFIDSTTVSLAPGQSPKVVEGSSPPKPFYRIKVYQQDNPDVIAIKATHGMSRADLLDKVFERVQASTAPKTSAPQKIGKLLLKDGQRWREFESDQQLSQWLLESQSHPALLYVPEE
ncbi:hypothetical protein VP01_1077g7 [Puccinia sorghi]|uniref:Bud emergence protein 1 n=1 Tax=Puccinia sorghi TaxID=27349 RepID=A0A0L6VTG4_9BASI|nr:hypothetical protein VP01_1077g7 [Puccinia sorghi]